MSLSTMRKLRTSPSWRSSLATHLQGQTIVVPDLHRIYTSTNAPVLHHSLSPTPMLCTFISTWIEKYIDSSLKRAKLHDANIPQCTANFWPGVQPVKQLLLGAFFAWFFAWDDEVDCGSLVGNQEKINKFGAESIDFIQRSLSDPYFRDRVVEEGDTEAHRSCATWKHIGWRVFQGQSEDDKERFAAALFIFIVGVCTPDPVSPLPPTLSNYLSRRIITIGSKPILLLHPWAYSLKLPSWIWDLDATKRMISAVGVGISLVNDITSLKKELDNGEVESAVPLMMLEEECGVQEAVDRVVQMIKQVWTDFTAAGKELKDEAAERGETERVKGHVETFVEACKNVLVGNVEYHLQAPRYTNGMKFEWGGKGYRLTL